jgi:hypothetical protein
MRLSYYENKGSVVELKNKRLTRNQSNFRSQARITTDQTLNEASVWNNVSRDASPQPGQVESPNNRTFVEV